MAESKSFGLSFMVLLVTALIIMGVMQMMANVLKGSVDTDMSAEAVQARIKPIGEVNTGAPMTAESVAPAKAPAVAAKAPAAARSGEQVYNSSCFACHGTGAAGAPKLGDAAAWAPRAAKGLQTLMDHALNGFNAMPPRGTCGACSEEELRSAVEYMLAKSK